MRRRRDLNPYVRIIHTSHGDIDPALIYDVKASVSDDQLPIRQLYFAPAEHPPEHSHADALSRASSGAIDASLLLDFLEHPPTGAYRIKGAVAVNTGRTTRGYQVDVVGRSIHVVSRVMPQFNELVAIGMHLNLETVHQRIARILDPTQNPSLAEGLRRLQRYRRLSG